MTKLSPLQVLLADQQASLYETALHFWEEALGESASVRGAVFDRLTPEKREALTGDIARIVYETYEADYGPVPELPVLALIAAEQVRRTIERAERRGRWIIALSGGAELVSHVEHFSNATVRAWTYVARWAGDVHRIETERVPGITTPSILAAGLSEQVAAVVAGNPPRGQGPERYVVALVPPDRHTPSETERMCYRHARRIAQGVAEGFEQPGDPDEDPQHWQSRCEASYGARSVVRALSRA